MSIKEMMTDEEKAALADAGRILAQVCRTVDATDGRLIRVVNHILSRFEALSTEQAKQQARIDALEAQNDALQSQLHRVVGLLLKQGASLGRYI